MTSAVPRHSSAEVPEGYRTDIDGLRAVAVLLVVTYHVWLGRVSGGVDVFLMLSAFFLTRSFLQHGSSRSAPSLLRRLLATFSRLVPAAAVTLLGVLVVTWLAYPATMWKSVWEQTIASIFYVQNWLLAADAVDYYQRSATPSPLQHFWSLSVQGQAFVLWTLLFGICVLIVRRTRRSPEAVVGLVFGAVFVLSLSYSVIVTSTAQSVAYFDTGARLWEFAAGSLLVLLVGRVHLTARAASVVGWASLTALVACGLVLDVRGGFPGVLALWPVICAAGIVISGSGPRPAGPSHLLSSRPLQIVGRDAYALYLVHWPVLVTWLVLQRRTEVGVLGGLFIVGLSLVLARILTATVDRPLRALRIRRGGVALPLAIIAGAAMIVTAPVMTWRAAEERAERVAAEASSATNPGARVLFDADAARPPAGAQIIPRPTQLDEEWAQLERECVGRFQITDEVLEGSCFQTAEATRRAHVVVVIGDSHAQQLTGALRPVADEQGWGVVTLIQGGCAMGLSEPGGDPVRCPPWREAALRHLESIRPDAVLTVVTEARAEDAHDERLRPGIERFLDRMEVAGIPVIAVRDNPRFAYDMFGCMLAADDPDECAVPRSASLSDTNPARALERPGVIEVDLTEWICPNSVCTPMVGNVAVYRDDNHLTLSYARTLAPVLARQLNLPAR